LTIPYALRSSAVPQKNAIMKKISLFAAAALFAAFTFSSCGEKCVVCEFGNGAADSELCSDSKDDRDAFVTLQELAATASSTTVNCEEK